MFDYKILDLYSAGDCHLLSYYIYLYLSEKSSESPRIYKLVSAVRKSKIIVHSLVYYNGFFYDIFGKYDSIDHVIRHWIAMYDEKYEDFEMSVSNGEELFDVIQYSEEEHQETRKFVDDNIDLLLSQDFVNIDFL